jgi:hypothetical protein
VSLRVTPTRTLRSSQTSPPSQSSGRSQDAILHCE